MLLAESSQVFVGRVQGVLGVGNQLSVGHDLFIGSGNFIAQQGNLLIHRAFLGYNAFHVVHIGIVLTLNAVNLLLNFLVLCLQRIDVFLYLRRGGGCRRKRQHTNHQCGRQQGG